MLEYPAHLLPPSPINPVEPVPVQWPSGTIINWVGEYKPKEYKSIYANRTKLFKGHKREREREARKAEVEARLETMDARIAEWRAVSTSERGGFSAAVVIDFCFSAGCPVSGEVYLVKCTEYPENAGRRPGNGERTARSQRKILGELALTVIGGRRGEGQLEADAAVLNITPFTSCIMHYSSENATQE